MKKKRIKTIFYLQKMMNKKRKLKKQHIMYLPNIDKEEELKKKKKKKEIKKKKKKEKKD